MAAAFSCSPTNPRLRPSCPARGGNAVISTSIQSTADVSLVTDYWMLKMPKSRIAIVGLGLIGGSMGLAIKQSKLDVAVIGHDKDSGVAGRAEKRGASTRPNGT